MKSCPKLIITLSNHFILQRITHLRLTYSFLPSHRKQQWRRIEQRKHRTHQRYHHHLLTRLPEPHYLTSSLHQHFTSTWISTSTSLHQEQKNKWTTSPEKNKLQDFTLSLKEKLIGTQIRIPTPQQKHRPHHPQHLLARTSPNSPGPCNITWIKHLRKIHCNT